MELAAPLCDLGNMAITTDILQKQGVLTESENEIMRRHTTIGARILRDISVAGSENKLVQMAIEIANFHHENWDGSGYPEGIKEEQIPLSAQIVAAIGTYCALTEKRVYREAFSKEEAIIMMEEEIGKKFNPDIFWVLKKIVKQLQ